MLFDGVQQRFLVLAAKAQRWSIEGNTLGQAKCGTAYIKPHMRRWLFAHAQEVWRDRGPEASRPYGITRRQGKLEPCAAHGIVFKFITAGEGEKPTAESTVSVHYHGSLTDGTVFDSSVERGQPAEFPVGGVIAGWTEALQLMTVGSKYKLTIPASLAYGERGAGAAIAPHSVLVFEVEY